MRLSLEERDALEATCNERLMLLAQQGAQIPGVQIRLLVDMIDQLLTPEQEADAKESWLFWYADVLDTAEAEIRKRFLTSGLGTNGAHPR